MPKINGLITPPCGVPSSVGASLPSSIAPAFSHPAIRSLAGEGAELAQDVTVVGVVERGLEVRVQCPPSLGAAARHGPEDGRDGVVAAASGPEAVAPRLEPGLPLGLQRAHRHGLKRPIGDHGNSQRSLLR